MEVILEQIPYITNENQCIYPIETEDYSIIFVFKQQFRGDDVLVNIYINEISTETLIRGDVLLNVGSLVSLQNNKQDFDWKVFCVNKDGVDEELNYTNAHKFYLQLERD